MSEPNEVTNCERCGKDIAAALEGEALCCRCRYGQLVEHEGEHVRDAVDEMRRHDSLFLAAAGLFALGATQQEDT